MTQESLESMFRQLIFSVFEAGCLIRCIGETVAIQHRKLIHRKLPLSC
jgi:hypothetical protein